MENPFVQALIVVVAGLYIAAFIMQKSRKQLSAEQLFLAEKFNNLNGFSFISLLPLSIVILTGEYYPSSRNIQIIFAVVATFIIFLYQARKNSNDLTMKGLPDDFAKSVFIAQSILALSFLTGAGIAVYRLLYS